MSRIRWIPLLMVATCLGAPLSLRAVPVSLGVHSEACTPPPGGLGATCVFDNTTKPANSVSKSTAGTTFYSQPFDSSAWARTDASNLGELRIAGGASSTGHGQATAISQIVINDFHRFSASGLAGQQGLVTATVLIAGSLGTTNTHTGRSSAEARALWHYQYDRTGSGAGSLLAVHNSHTQMRDNWTIDVCSIGGSFVGCDATYGVFTFDIPFIWGEDAGFLLQFRGDASAFPSSDDATLTAEYQLGNSVYWGGFSNVRAGGRQVTDYDYTSGSNFDWRSSSIVTGTVPEPGMLMLSALGLVAGVFSRRRNGSPDST